MEASKVKKYGYRNTENCFLAKTFEKKKENINDKLKVVFIRNSR
jgi:hypothetical protein